MIGHLADKLSGHLTEELLGNLNDELSGHVMHGLIGHLKVAWQQDPFVLLMQHITMQVLGWARAGQTGPWGGQGTKANCVDQMTLCRPIPSKVIFL